MRQRPSALTAADKASLTDVPDFRSADRELLVGHSLDVRDVTGDVVTWHHHPTEAEQAFAAELLGRRVQHVV